MNVIFFTQSRSLDIFYELYLRVRAELGIEQVGFYVANLRHYESFLARHPGFDDRFLVLKESDIYREAAGHDANLARIRRYEQEIGDPTLWGVVAADRRLYMGGKATFRQNYKPRFSHDRLMAILDVVLMRINDLFRQVQPDLICTIYTATFGDCIGHLFAKARGIKALDLRLARLKNHVMFVDGVSEPPPHIAELFERFKAGIPANLKKDAEDYAESVVEGSAMYEGVVPAIGARHGGGRSSGSSDGRSTSHFFGRCIGFAKRYYISRRVPYCYDYQNPDIVQALIYSRVLNPLNLRMTRTLLRGSLVDANALRVMDFILYPLHTEPELVLAQFARPYLNQIEVVRNIGLSMPVGMKLLVKEHPMMLGRRSLRYYKKLLEIPNVELVDFELPSEVVVAQARLTVIIRGAIGLEAVVRRKPVVSLGRSMFDMLPSSMFKSCRSMYDLPEAIESMLNGYTYDHSALIRYLAAVMKGSVGVNLVSDLLGKKGRFRGGVEWNGESLGDHPHLDLLGDYMVARARACVARGRCSEER